MCTSVYIENNTWMHGNTRFMSSVEHEHVMNMLEMSRSYDW